MCRLPFKKNESIAQISYDFGLAQNKISVIKSRGDEKWQKIVSFNNSDEYLDLRYCLKEFDKYIDNLWQEVEEIYYEYDNTLAFVDKLTEDGIYTNNHPNGRYSLSKYFDNHLFAMIDNNLSRSIVTIKLFEKIVCKYKKV